MKRIEDFLMKMMLKYSMGAAKNIVDIS